MEHQQDIQANKSGRQAGIRQPSPHDLSCPRPTRVDGTFISILQLLANSPVPPHELYSGGPRAIPLIFEDPIIPILVVRQLAVIIYFFCKP